MTKLEVVPLAITQPPYIFKSESGRVEAWFFWAIWLSTWFSPFKLNKLGDMHMRGKNFPKCAQSPITNSECLEVLTSMESYYAPIKKKK
jgi:hypothetical protein